MKKYSVGYIIAHGSGRWDVVRQLPNDYTQEDAEQLLDEMLDEGLIAFQNPPVHSNEGLPELGTFHDAMVEQIKTMLDEIEKEKGDQIYDQHMNRLCRIHDFHNARRIFESLAQEMHDELLPSRENEKL